MAVPHRAPLSQTVHDANAAPRLIVADAALALVARWRGELAILQRRSPTSDAVKTLSDCVHELAQAITAGRDVSVLLTLLEAHDLSRIPLSTLRWLCNHRTDSIGASKQAGAWYVDRSKFEAFITSRHETSDRARHAALEQSPESPGGKSRTPSDRELRLKVERA